MSGQIARTRCATGSELVTLTSPYDGIRYTVHRALQTRVEFAFRIAHEFAPFEPERIDSYNCRPIRGGTTLSRHAAGAALDIFATGPTIPPPGGVWTPDSTFGNRFARPFTDLGFTWGRQFSRRDDPHVEWSGDYVPPLTRKERRHVRALAKVRRRRHNKREGKR